jgi:hypothetical protein
LKGLTNLNIKQGFAETQHIEKFVPQKYVDTFKQPLTQTMPAKRMAKKSIGSTQPETSKMNQGYGLGLQKKERRIDPGNSFGSQE